MVRICAVQNVHRMFSKTHCQILFSVVFKCPLVQEFQPEAVSALTAAAEERGLNIHHRRRQCPRTAPPAAPAGTCGPRRGRCGFRGRVSHGHAANGRERRQHSSGDVYVVSFTESGRWRWCSAYRIPCGRGSRGGKPAYE